MVAKRYIKIFSIAMIVALLVSSVESAPAEKKESPAKPKSSTDSQGCPVPPEKIKSLSNDNERFIVFLNNEGDKKKHLDMMGNCYKTKFQPLSGIKDTKLFSASNNIAIDFSVNGTKLQGYSMKMSSEASESIKKLSTVALVEKEEKFSIQYVLPLNRRAVDNKPNKNLDRIDQAKLPLDGKYTFPDSAGSGVNIFVVDTGVRTTHSEFENRAKFGGSFCDGCNDDDENGHGTNVASIAAGKTNGVARKANIIAVRVLDANGAGSNTGVINGLSFVLDQHQKGKNKNSVVNMSLGGAFSKAVNKAVQDLTKGGVHVAVAAGNDGEDACKSSPASEPSAVTVGAIEINADQIADFSNVGSCLDVFAPGVDIKGAGIKNDNDVSVLSGTSQATPHVAGALALIIGKDGNTDPAAMAKKLVDLSSKGNLKNVGDSPDRILRVPAP